MLRRRTLGPVKRPLGLLLGVLATVLVGACSAGRTSNVSYDSATLNGTVRWELGDGPGHVWWEYRRLGHETWSEQGPRSSWPRMDVEPTTVEKTLSGLAETTTYEYRICGSLDTSPEQVVCLKSDGSSDGEWDRFTTTAHPTVTPSSAFVFNDSVGVASHPTYLDTVYSEMDRIAGLMADAGIRHVRNGMAISTDPAWNELVWSKMRAWPGHGIASSWAVDRCAVTHDPGHTVRMFLDKIAEIDGDLSSAIEGTNEVDQFCTPDWVNRERAYVADLFHEVRSHPDPIIQSLPVLGPSFAHGGASQLGDTSQWMDFGNTHPYSGCTSPTPAHVQQNGIDSYAPAAAGKPIIVTEVGFHTAMNMQPGGGQPPCDERTGGVYTLRTFLEHFKLGIRRSYIYEAIDLWPDPGKTNPEWNFGLLRNDFTPKPAYTYLKNLLATTTSPDHTSLAPLKLNVEQGPSDLRTLLLRQADGDYVLALWRHASVWDRDARKPITVDPADVRISLPTAEAVARVEPHVSTAESSVPVSDRRVTIPVGGDAVLLVIR
jgi:hypothetical protein